MFAVGIDDHPDYKLGLRAPTPAAPALKLGDFLTGTVPQHPTNVDYLAGITFGLYGNDRFGVCGPTFVANSCRETTARLTGKMVAPTQADVFDLYRRSGNPNFDPNTGADDNGVNMQVMLSALNTGGIGGKKCLGFAKVDVSDIEELKAAIAIFGFLGFGVTLQQAQQNQTNTGMWDYQPSGQWGGHAILGGKYQASPEGVNVITWAKEVRMTDRFIQNQVQEAWVVIWPEHLRDDGFLKGVDLKAFAKAYQDMTGRAFPANVTPPTPPDPTPAGSWVLTIKGTGPRPTVAFA